MKDIIDQIVQIDSMTYENKKKNEEFLLRKKEEYEDNLKLYRENRLSEAKNQADTIYKEYRQKELNETANQDEQLKRIDVKFENRFKEIETGVIKEIIDDLFMREE